MSQSSNVFEFGVLMFPYYQWLDAAGPIDYISSHNKTMAQLLELPEHLINKAPTLNWHYLSSAGNLDPILATSGPLQTPTTTFATCPPLDYILVPGPDPNLVLSEECIKFLKDRFPQLKGLLIICTGSMVLAQTGLLDGLNVASNKYELKAFAEKGILNKNVKWVGDRRYVKDGKVWSAAGISSGLDLGAEFSRINFDPELFAIVRDVHEYNQNPAHPDIFARILDGVKLD